MPERGAGQLDLASPLLGAAVLAVSDDFFAAARRMLDPGEPRFIPDLYDANGKWMDGWESRRRRDGGQDWCVLRIRPGVIHQVQVDTRHFIGNYPAEVSLEACYCEADPIDGSVGEIAATPGFQSRWGRRSHKSSPADWKSILARSPLGPDRVHEFTIDDASVWTHLRLNIFPDGGVARLRVFGQAERVPEDLARWQDLSSGGTALYCNDQHFGHMDNLFKAAAPQSMADGWETRRRREPGNDFVVLRLGRPGRIACALVDTAFFRGNHPARCALRGLALGDAPISDPEASENWPLLLPPLALGADQQHRFDWQLLEHEAVDHVRLDIFPDGGVARLRLLGEPA